MAAPLLLPRYYQGPQTGDYLMAYEAYRQPTGYKYAVRATAIAGDVGSLTILDVAGAYLRRCAASWVLSRCRARGARRSRDFLSPTT